jgi:hypothetical protein
VTGREGEQNTRQERKASECGDKKGEKDEARAEMCRMNGRRKGQAINQKLQECMDVLCETNKK